MTDTYQVRDGSRLITFTGQRLGFISSQRDGNPRWTEMSVYKTDGGTYVLEKVGKSLVMHWPGCPDIKGEIPRFQEAHPGDDPDDGYTFHDCVPEEYDFTKLLVEEDRYWSMVADMPERVVEALYRRREGSTHLPRIAMDLLEQVSTSDPAFGLGWRVAQIS
jgi:hypothetical protein